MSNAIAIQKYLHANLYTVKNPMDDGSVKDITPSYEQEQKAFGDYDDNQGELAILFPEVFGDDAVQASHPSASLSYARCIIALEYLDKAYYHYYSEEKHNFFESEAYREAEAAGKKFLIMENLS